MEKLIEDLSILTTIPEKTLTKISDKIIYCISDAIEESICENKNITEINMSIGTLYIKHTDDEIKYKFVPSDKLSKAVTDTVCNKLNLLEDVIENTIIEKVENIYKDLL